MTCNNRLSKALQYITETPQLAEASRRRERAEHNSRSKERRQRDPSFVLSDKLFTRLRWHLLCAKRDNATEFGLSVYALRAHIESQFRGEMAWSNYGKVWEIDHVCPRKLWREDMVRCFHYTNLRPRLVYLNRLDGRM